MLFTLNDEVPVLIIYPIFFCSGNSRMPLDVKILLFLIILFIWTVKLKLFQWRNLLRLMTQNINLRLKTLNFLYLHLRTFNGINNSMLSNKLSLFLGIVSSVSWCYLDFILHDWLFPIRSLFGFTFYLLVVYQYWLSPKLSMEGD